jgi:hypothetical protein
MQQRCQRISFLPSNRAMGTFSPLIKDVMACNGTQQCIVYSNSRAKLVNIHNALHVALDAQHHLHRCDVVLITGPQSKEQKFHRTKLFLGYDNSSIDDNAFNAICCMTTRALGSAGWDSARIRKVFSFDFPIDILSIVQEKGRSGRCSGAGPLVDLYFVIASLESYLYLLHRIERDPTGHDPEDYALFDSLMPLHIIVPCNWTSWLPFFCFWFFPRSAST